MTGGPPPPEARYPGTLGLQAPHDPLSMRSTALNVSVRPRLTLPPPACERSRGDAPTRFILHAVPHATKPCDAALGLAIKDVTQHCTHAQQIDLSFTNAFVLKWLFTFVYKYRNTSRRRQTKLRPTPPSWEHQVTWQTDPSCAKLNAFIG